MIHETKTQAHSAGPVWLFPSPQANSHDGSGSVRHGIWMVDNLHCRVVVHGTSPLYSERRLEY